MFEIVGREEQAFEQWEQGARVSNPCMKAGDEVVFRNSSGATAVMIAMEESGQVVADVPNKLLQMALCILVDLGQSNELHSECRTSFRVNPAEKPADYSYIDNTVREEEKSSGGGSGADLLNENGIIKQEYLPKGFPYKSGKDAVIMEATKLEYDADAGGIVYKDKYIKLLPGEEYIVSWNGVEYTSTAVDGSGLGEGIECGLGNVGALTGGEPTSDPFVIFTTTEELGAMMGFFAMVLPLDDSTTVDISITGFVGDLQKIDEQYLPEQESDTVVVKVVGSYPTVNTWSHTTEDVEALLEAGKTVRLEVAANSTVLDRKIYHLNSYGSGAPVFYYVNANSDETLQVYTLQMPTSIGVYYWKCREITVAST